MEDALKMSKQDSSSCTRSRDAVVRNQLCREPIQRDLRGKATSHGMVARSSAAPGVAD